VHEMSPRWGWARRTLRSQGRGQGLVEYGLIAALVGIVTFAGLSVLTAHETAYFNGMSLTPKAPDAPGALLHPTSATFVCTPNKVRALIPTLITCTATVDDTFSNTSDLKPPRGRVTWTFPDGSKPYCDLPNSPATGFRTQCSRNYQPTPNSYIPGTYTVTAQYDPMGLSNHFPAPAPPSSVTVDQPTLDASCTNAVNTTLPVGQVELGYPLDCQVKLSSWGSPVAGQTITWTNAVPTVGGILACRTQGTGLPNIWTDYASCKAPRLDGTGSLPCVTNASGVCGVIYRRVYDTFGGGANTTPVLSLQLVYANGTATNAVYPDPTKTPPDPPIRVIAPIHQHPTETVAVCKRTALGSATVAPPTNVDVGSAHFQRTPSIDQINGMAEFSCDIRVVDKDPNPAFYGPGSTSNSDIADAYPPLGATALTYTDSTGAPSIVGNCVLNPVPSTVVPPAQAHGQEPFFAQCTSLNIHLSDVPASSGTLTVAFSAEPGHGSSSLDILVSFN
jgi:Flp pilus assembly pilin Flp